ncbi:MAG TPA: SBBP repeat-containing protein, partial [Pyrinomonadaceae bacterium]|nr:SBBP repeat-containing protein [Pyrinomonadaceae bacterium]
MKLNDADTAPAVEGLEALPGSSNYLVGSDRSRWVGDVPGFAKVQYKAVYPGVDLVCYGAGANLEYDFRLAPDADPRQIKLTFSGAQAMRLDAASGDLVLRVGGRELRQHAPVAYQEKDGVRQPVASRYRIAGRREVGFELGEYDRTAPLVIDPTLTYSTYVGGNSLDGAIGIAVDSQGDAYVTGGTFSPNYPTTPGAFQTTYGGSGDFFVTKLNPSGTGAVYSTYIGGSDNEAAFAIALDADGHAWVTGPTASPNYPVTADAYQHARAIADYDVAVTKLSADGSALEYSTYLGGGNTDFGTGVAVDSNGDAYVTGYVGTAGFPTTPGSFQSSYGAGRTGFQPFIAKLGPAASADTTPPTVTCGSPDGLWHSTDVSIQCTANDTGSGLADPADASFLLSTHVPAGTETANASTDSHAVCDLAGNCTSAGPVAGNRVDKKGPTIAINSPTATGYSLGTSVTASYTCSDAGSGVATCTGTVSSGSPIDTSSFGAKSFTVTATDNVGNTSTQTVTYNVTYNVCLDYNPKAVYQAGSTIPIKLSVCDPNGNNLSSSSISLRAVGVGLVSTAVVGDVDSSGNANPDGDFRLIGGFYVFNMSTKGMGTGSYYLYFTVGSDPTL